MAKHILIDCTLIKNHPDCNSCVDYLVDNNFVPNVDTLPDGIFNLERHNILRFAFNDFCVEKFSFQDENKVFTDTAVLINMDCTRIELLIDADGESSPTERSIARKALSVYLRQLNLKSKDSVVFHLGEVLRDAFKENKEELPSGVYTIVDTPFHRDIISNVLNNISIHRHDDKIEQVILEALGISREQANFVHAFYNCSTFSRHSTHFDYRYRHWTLFLTADANGDQAIEVSPLDSDIRVKIDDIHDLKSVIDKNFFNTEAPKETPKEEPEAEPEEAPTELPDISVSIKANTYIDLFHRKADEIIAHTEAGKDWHLEFADTASPKEVVGYYFYTYGTSQALEKWRNNHEDTNFSDEVDKIFDSIFCPFCKQGKPVKFDSSNDMYLKRCDLHDNKVDCYAQGDSYVGTMVFPNCPLCGDKLEKK